MRSACPDNDRSTFINDAAGRRTVRWLANGSRTSYTHDAADQITQVIDHASGGAVISSFDYRYDKAGNRASVVQADGARVTWSYDAANRLIGENRCASKAGSNGQAHAAPTTIRPSVAGRAAGPIRSGPSWLRAPRPTDLKRANGSNQII